MRYLGKICLSVSALAALASAQTLNLATGGTNTGNVGGGIYFNLTVNTTVTFTSITYGAKNDGVGPFQSSFDLFVGPSTYVNNVGANPGPWVQVATTTPVTLTGGTGAAGSGPVQLLTGVLNPAGVNPGTITFVPGTYGLAFKATNHQWSYTNGAFTFTNTQLSATLGAASNVFLALPTFSPRSFNGAINYTLGGTPMQFAQRSPYGDGCYRNFRSIYELFPSSVFVDFNNTSLYWTLDAANNRWSLITPGTTPVNTAAVTSPSLGHADDSNILVALANSQPILFPNIGALGVATSAVEMSSNGYLSLSGSGPTTPNPTSALFINGTSVKMGNWHNLTPAAGGTTNYDYDVATSTHLFTWLNVPTMVIGTGPAGTNTFQMAFFPNGDCEMRWGAMYQGCGGTCPTIIGFSPGATSLDPGSIDLSASLPAFTAGFDQPALALAAGSNPILGTTVNLTTSNPTGVNIGVCFVGLSDLPPFSPVGLDLGIIGAPGCVANIDINVAVGSVISNLGTPFPSMIVPFAIPSGPLSILGLSFYSQSVWLDPLQNAAGLITSNAVQLKIGAF